MKFLLDQNISPRTTAFLRSLGHDAVDTRDLRLADVADEEIWRLCLSQDRTLLSFDLGFCDVRDYPDTFGPGIIIFKTRSAKSSAVNAHLRTLLHQFREDEIRGRLIVITENRFRLRKK